MHFVVDAGFPPNEEFKWSPRRDMWMHQNLVAERRQVFFFLDHPDVRRPRGEGPGNHQ